MVAIQQVSRHKTHQTMVGNVSVGGGSPIRVQAMTDTATANIPATIKQIKELALAGAELVRITVNDKQAASAVPHIIETLRKDNFLIPIIGDFHYNGHTLLKEHPDCAKMLDKYRINPGNVGFGKKQNQQFKEIVETAIKWQKPIRIGVNWGSIDQDLSLRLMDENAKLSQPKDSDDVMREVLIQSALISAAAAEEIGMAKDKIIVSCKVSRVQDLIAIYHELANRSNYCLHLGLTEAGMGSKGIVVSTAALALILQSGIGDTIRISLTPEPGAKREKEAIVAQEILQSLGFRNFAPQVSACPGCGRTTSSYFRELAKEIQSYLREELPVWKEKYPGIENLNVAVMGCIVNGPGESKHANIGISLPGSGESSAAPVFIDGEKFKTLRGDNIAADFKEILIDYIQKKYGK